MKIIFVIGPACAGKSTYIKNNFSDFEKIDLYDFQKDYPFLGYEEVVESYDKCKDALIEAIKSNKNVVMEHTLLRAIRREVYIDAVKELGDYKIECVLIKPSAEVLADRQKQRGIPYSIERAKDELDVLEDPTEDEGFSKITIIEYNDLDKEPDIDER